MSKEVKIIIGVGLAVAAGGFFLFTQQPKQLDPGQLVDSQALIRDTSHMTGKKDAKVSVVEFGDYQCPACATAAPILSRLREEYKNIPEVNFVFRHFPLAQHERAIVAAQAAEAAAEQGKFWEMTDKLYQTQNQWIGSVGHEPVFQTLAQELGLDVDKFRQAAESNKYSDIIKADQSDGTALEVNSTPTFFINGLKTAGFGYEELKSTIEEKLK